MIKNIVFDIGNVLLSFHPREYLAETFSDPHICNVLYDTIFSSNEWVMLDRGTITHDEAAALFMSRVPQYKKEIQHIMNAGYSELLLPIETTISTLKKLKARGYKIFLLSNFHERALCQMKEKYDFFSHTDGMVVSYQVKMIKPEPAIYKILLGTYNLVPSETLFIDDMPQNIRGAESVGIDCIHFLNHDQFAADLAARKIRV